MGNSPCHIVGPYSRTTAAGSRHGVCAMVAYATTAEVGISEISPNN